jgi:hypothetical protein
MRPLENAEENVRRLTENHTLSLPLMDRCCETKKSTHCSCVQCGIEYCSIECRQNAFESYHQTLCLGQSRKDPNNPVNFLMEIWKQIHLPPETTTIYLILKLIAMIKQVSEII